MIKFSAAFVTVLLLASSAYAAEPQISAADIKANLDAVASDASKVAAYCAMSKKMDEVGDDEKKAEAAGDEIDGYFKTLGDDFMNAWDAGQDAADGTPEAKAMDEGLSALDAKCK